MKTEKIVDEWMQLDEKQHTCSDLMSKYDVYARKMFCHYEPTVTAGHDIPRDFFARMDLWLKCFSTDEDRWNAFLMIDDLFFIGRHELIELYRIVFDNIVPDWLINCKNIKLNDKDYYKNLQTVKEKVWFCPITDSLRISAFRHINHIERPEYFPDWRSLEKFGSIDSIKSYVDEKVEALVLIEDFVGSGRQITPAITFAAENLNIPILISPLLVAPTGDKHLRQIEEKYPQVTYHPVVVIPEDCILRKALAEKELEKCRRNHSVVQAYASVANDQEPFGNERDQGYLVITEANCPNNSVKPLYANKNWTPLFPRSGRRKLK